MSVGKGIQAFNSSYKMHRGIQLASKVSYEIANGWHTFHYKIMNGHHEALDTDGISAITIDVDWPLLSPFRAVDEAL